jgi:Domain of unknown function (DUF222)
VGPPGGRPSAGRRRAGRWGGGVGVVCPGDLPEVGKVPEDCRPAADAVLVAAAKAGAALEDLAGLAAEIYTRSLPDPGPGDDGPDDRFEDRSLRLEITFDGAGVVNGDLTAECAAVVTAVLESLSARCGAEDTRTREQRYHDGLHEAMRRLVAGGVLPGRAGQPVKAWAHVSLAGLRAMDGGSVLEEDWVSAVRAGWAAARAASSVAGGDGGARLDGDAAAAAACDASRTPIVSGEVDIGAPEDLVRLCVELDRLDHAAGRDEPGSGPSLPLDIGYSQNVPAGIRNAVIARDRHCRRAGGGGQPAAACEVHHATHKARGGKTSTRHCLLLCLFHHQIVIHRRGWTLVLNPDGTTPAWNPDRTKVLHSHGPPARPAPVTHPRVPSRLIRDDETPTLSASTVDLRLLARSFIQPSGIALKEQAP